MKGQRQEGRDLRCKAPRCGGRLVVETRGGVTVEHCPACEKRERAFPYGVRRSSLPCAVCGLATKQSARGKLVLLCPACKAAKAKHEKIARQLPSKPSAA